ncbi:MAG: hypothetical protein CMB80_02455 [Flammeovirgaceae bacterium]|nr:hypothetical protein [Flammeovirgaceae bacterium]
MADFDWMDALSVLDTIGTIANDATRTKYQYQVDQKRQALADEKWEHQLETDEFNQDFKILKNMQEALKTDMSQPDYEAGFVALKDHVSQIGNPELREMGENMVNSKEYVGTGIKAKRAHHENILDIFEQADKLKDEHRSLNFAGSDYLLDLAKQVRQGTLNNAEFIDAHDEQVYYSMAKGMEDYANAANYLKRYDETKDDTYQVNNTDKPIRVMGQTIQPGDKFLVNQFDLDQAMEEFEVRDRDGNVITNEYELVLDALDLIKSGHPDEAVRAIAKIPSKMQTDARTANNVINKKMRTDMKAMLANIDVNDKTNARTNRNGQKLMRIAGLDEIENRYTQLKRGKSTAEVENLNAQHKQELDEYYKDRYTDLAPEDRWKAFQGDPEAYFNNEMKSVKSKTFSRPEFDNWDEITRTAQGDYRAAVTEDQQDEVRESRAQYMNFLKDITEGDPSVPKVDQYLKDIIDTKGSELTAPIGTGRSDVTVGGAKLISRSRFQEAMKGPAKLLSSVINKKMGESQGIGLTGPKDLFTSADYAIISNQSDEPTMVRAREKATFRLLNDIFWTGNEAQLEFAEQVGSDWWSRKGTGTKEQGTLEFFRTTRKYYNELFMNDIMHNYKNEGGNLHNIAKEDLNSVISDLIKSRRGAKKGLTKFKDLSPQEIQSDTYDDLLKLKPYDETWKDILQESFKEREAKDINHNLETWKPYLKSLAENEMDESELVDRLKLYYMGPDGPGTEDVKNAWAKAFLEATDTDRQLMLNRVEANYMPSFLR